MNSLKHVAPPLMPKEISFRSALVECLTYGCTMVLNRVARDLIVAHNPTDLALTHDWWCYLVVAAVGDVIFDPRPSLKYRQHKNNNSGAPPGFFKSWLNRLNRLYKNRALTPWHRQAIAVARLYKGQLTSEQLKTLNMIEDSKCSWYMRSQLALSSRIRRDKHLDDCLLRLLILLGAYS